MSDRGARGIDITYNTHKYMYLLNRHTSSQEAIVCSIDIAQAIL